MFIETVKNILNISKELPRSCFRNARMDAQLLVESYGVPEYVHARNGKRYLYFDYKSGMDFTLMRQMGLKPKLHYSKYRFPGEWVCRIPVDGNMSKNAMNVIAELKDMAKITSVKINNLGQEYEQYKTRYKSAFFVKTK